MLHKHMYRSWDYTSIGYNSSIKWNHATRLNVSQIKPATCLTAKPTLPLDSWEGPKDPRAQCGGTARPPPGPGLACPRTTAVRSRWDRRPSSRCWPPQGAALPGRQTRPGGADKPGVAASWRRCRSRWSSRRSRRRSTRTRTPAPAALWTRRWCPSATGSRKMEFWGSGLAGWSARRHLRCCRGSPTGPAGWGWAPIPWCRWSSRRSCRPWAATAGTGSRGRTQRCRSRWT